MTTNNAINSPIINSSVLINFTGAFTLNNVSIGYSVIGKIVVLSFPDILATATSAAILTSTALPSNIRTAVKVDQPGRITDNATQPNNCGLVRLRTDGVIEIYKDLSGSVFTGSGNTGLQSFSISYKIN